jgi:hypothetical protein
MSTPCSRISRGSTRSSRRQPLLLRRRLLAQRAEGPLLAGRRHGAGQAEGMAADRESAHEVLRGSIRVVAIPNVARAARLASGRCPRAGPTYPVQAGTRESCVRPAAGRATDSCEQARCGNRPVGGGRAGGLQPAGAYRDVAKRNGSGRDRRRVIIEGCAPEIDGGRFPCRRVVGEDVVVEADIFTDGHEAISARLFYRHERERRWRETPMEFLGNDRWRGRFPPTASAATATRWRRGWTRSRAGGATWRSGWPPTRT